MNNKSPFDARYPDLLEGPDDPALLDLVHDLDALYTANPIPAQIIHPQEAQSLHLVPSEHTQGLQSGTFLPPTSKAARRWSRLNALAAVLFTMLLVGALAGIFYTVHHRAAPAHQGPTPTLGSTPTLSVTSTPAPGVVLGPQACPAQVAAPAYWEPIISPSAYGGPHHVELVSCANLMGTPSLQALVTVRRGDDGLGYDGRPFPRVQMVGAWRDIGANGLPRHVPQSHALPGRSRSDPGRWGPSTVETQCDPGCHRFGSELAQLVSPFHRDTTERRRPT